MQLSFTRAPLSAVQDEIGQHLESLPGPIDEFMEDHLRGSQHYVISVLGSRAGLAAIHAGKLITHFSLERDYQRFGQAVFQALRKLEYVSAAYVPTCDELYLSHAIDDYRELAKQAYFFEAPPSTSRAAEQQYSLRPASAGDEAAIREQSGDLFGNIHERIEKGEIFVTERSPEQVGFGVLARSHFQRDAASIGMFTRESFRGTGVAVATITLLLEECARRRLRATAGCWYYNHASKRTLERAGMSARTRLLRVEY